jgi:hypothetical protein
MTLTTDNRMTVTSLSAPSTPRLRMEPTASRGIVLDGGWWPRSTDPVAELPGLVLALDKLRGPVTRLLLSAEGWDSRPRRLTVAGRVVRIGYFASQPTSLLTALYHNGRVDLLIVPHDTARRTADEAMALAATTSNLVHAHHILPAVSKLHATETDGVDVWETEGGHLAPTPPPTGPESAHAGTCRLGPDPQDLPQPTGRYHRYPALRLPGPSRQLHWARRGRKPKTACTVRRP